MTNPIVAFGQEFIDANIKGVEVSGITQLFQSAFDEAEMPILVVERKNKIYLIRKDWERNGEVVSSEDS